MKKFYFLGPLFEHRSGCALLIECVELCVNGTFRRAITLTQSKCFFFIWVLEYLYDSELSMSTMVV